MYLIFNVATAPEQRETVMLVCPDGSNPYHALHRLGVEYAMSPEGAKVRGIGLTFGALFEHLTPEALAPYGIEIMWPDREAVRLEDGRQIVSCYEIQSHLEAREQERQRTINWERRLRETSERFARKMERLKADGHPVLSTWDASRICGRSISWAYQHVKAGGLDADGFFERKLADAKPCKASSPQDAGGADEKENIAQSA